MECIIQPLEWHMPVEQQITADCDDSSSWKKSSRNVLWAISNKLTHSLNKWSRFFSDPNYYCTHLNFDEAVEDKLLMEWLFSISEVRVTSQLQQNIF